MADFKFPYHKFCPVEVNGCPRVRIPPSPPIIKTVKLYNCPTVKLTNSIMPYTYYINALIWTVVGVVFWTYPPKKINEFYGYRTTRSRKSQEAWDFAQRYSAKLLTIFGFAALIVAAAAHLFRNSLCVNSDYLMLYDVCIILLLPIIVVLPPIVLTELELRKRFG